jgi:hypothetical protein
MKDRDQLSPHVLHDVKWEPRSSNLIELHTARRLGGVYPVAIHFLKPYGVRRAEQNGMTNSLL